MQTLFAPTEEQEMMRSLARQIARERIAPLATEIDRAEEFSKDIFELLGSHGMLRLLVPEKYGGEESSFLGFCLTLEEISRISPTCAAVCAIQNLGARLININGTEEQKIRYLPSIGSGKTVFGFALTESEPSAVNITAATLTAAPQGDGYLLNGSGYYIANGDIADICSIFARNISPQSNRDIILPFIVEKGRQGFAVKRTVGMQGSEARYTCEAIFKDCLISKEDCLGGNVPGIDILFSILPEVSCSAAARAIGLAQTSLTCSIYYALQRIQFKRQIGQFQAIQSMLAGMSSKTEAARQLLYKAASLVDDGNGEALRFSAMAKYFATDAAMSVTIDGVQIHGGIGYMRDFPVERLMRNAKLTQVTDINNLVQQVIIAKSLLGYS